MAHVQHKRRRRRGRRPTSAITLPALVHDSQVLRLPEVAQLAGIGKRTLARLMAAGKGPRVVYISDQRRGVSVGAYKEWIASREAAS
jgi:predicted DNA-binding transcriptional regulator AlpA